MMEKLQRVAGNSDLLNVIIVVGLLVYLYVGNGAYEIQSFIIGGLVAVLRVNTGADGKKEDTK